MTHRVFIDGEAGTTGLQIRDRLQARDDISLVSLPDTHRKDLSARLQAYEQADVAILCLPDASVHEIVPQVTDLGTRLIDASTAHRTDPDWVFGFCELTPDTRARIAAAPRVSNPGCYSTGAIALLHPLVTAGIIAPDAPIAINAVSGYSGGGRAMVEEFESGASDGFFLYATGQKHKHIPEIIRYAGLTKRPIFVPSVGHFAQGMIVQIPLPFLPVTDATRLEETLAAHYAGATFVKVVSSDSYEARIDPRKLNGTNQLELSAHGDPETGTMVLMALLDNLGKGASGAAVQNLNIMLGVDETTGL